MTNQSDQSEGSFKRAADSFRTEEGSGRDTMIAQSEGPSLQKIVEDTEDGPITGVLHEKFPDNNYNTDLIRELDAEANRKKFFQEVGQMMPSDNCMGSIHVREGDDIGLSPIEP